MRDAGRGATVHVSIAPTRRFPAARAKFTRNQWDRNGEGEDRDIRLSASIPDCLDLSFKIIIRAMGQERARSADTYVYSEHLPPGSSMANAVPAAVTVPAN